MIDDPRVGAHHRALMAAALTLFVVAAASMPLVSPVAASRAAPLERELARPRTGPAVGVAAAPVVGPARGVEVVPPPEVRVAAASGELHHGLGAWVDAFDHGRAYQRDGGAPPVGPAVVDTLARHGVTTLYLQVTRIDDRSPDGWVDHARSAAIVEAAHDRGIGVVGWFLPRFEDPALDLNRLRMLLAFRSPRGDRLDGVGVDIESQAVADPALRSRRLVDLGAAFRPEARAAGMTVAGIVMPPLHLEEVNPRFWPGFPWAAIADHYDVWMTMGYWSQRRAGTRHADPAAYTSDNVARLRQLVGDRPIHPIGGVADGTTPAEMSAFVAAARAGGAIGWSVYDVNTTDAAEWAALAAG